MLYGRGRYFTRKAGEVSISRPIWGRAEQLQSRRGRSPAQRAGLLFEEKVIAKLKQTEKGFLSHLPFQFFSSHDAGFAVPDGIIFNPPKLILVEIKLRHTVDAWHQLNEFYLPIVQCAFPWAQISCWEICKNYDPGIQLPGAFTLHSSKPTQHNPAALSIWIWGRNK
jgi:hypothetical protein